MLYYPQLASGAIAQFPVSRRGTMRTVVNQLVDGSSIRMPDTGAQRVRWKLGYLGLTDAERLSIEGLFKATEGQLTTFTFLDPTDNLLMWSEDWTQAVWAADPLLQVGSGVQDPLGGAAALQLTNTGQMPQQILQETCAPSSFLHCFSVYVRSNAPTTVQLVAAASGQTSLTPVAVGPSWRRALASGSLGVQQDTISFGVNLPAGTQVDVFGAQVEAQPEAGVYKKTTDRGGIYSKTRFAADSLAFAANAPNQHSAQVELISSLL